MAIGGCGNTGPGSVPIGGTGVAMGGACTNGGPSGIFIPGQLQGLLASQKWKISGNSGAQHGQAGSGRGGETGGNTGSLASLAGCCSSG